MSKVIADISMSLDGYVTAPGAGQEHGREVTGSPRATHLTYEVVRD